jgi:hypothetical protein
MIDFKNIAENANLNVIQAAQIQQNNYFAMKEEMNIARDLIQIRFSNVSVTLNEMDEKFDTLSEEMKINFDQLKLISNAMAGRIERCDEITVQLVNDMRFFWANRRNKKRYEEENEKDKRKRHYTRKKKQLLG